MAKFVLKKNLLQNSFENYFDPDHLQIRYAMATTSVFAVFNVVFIVIYSREAGESDARILNPTV